MFILYQFCFLLEIVQLEISLETCSMMELTRAHLEPCGGSVTNTFLVIARNSSSIFLKYHEFLAYQKCC